MLEELTQEVYKDNFDIVKLGLFVSLLCFLFCITSCSKDEEIPFCYSAGVIDVENDSVYARLTFDTPDATKPPYPNSLLVFGLNELNYTPQVGDMISFIITDWELKSKNDNYEFMSTDYMLFRVNVEPCQ